jgi:hypothetical protein
MDGTQASSQFFIHGLAVFLCYFREREISHVPISPPPPQLSPHSYDSLSLKSLSQPFISAAPDIWISYPGKISKKNFWGQT